MSKTAMLGYYYRTQTIRRLRAKGYTLAAIAEELPPNHDGKKYTRQAVHASLSNTKSIDLRGAIIEWFRRVKRAAQVGAEVVRTEKLRVDGDYTLRRAWYVYEEPPDLLNWRFEDG